MKKRAREFLGVDKVLAEWHITSRTFWGYTLWEFARERGQEVRRERGRGERPEGDELQTIAK